MKSAEGRDMKTVLFRLIITAAAFAFSFVFFVGCGEKSEDHGTRDVSETRADRAKDGFPDGLTPEQASKVVAKVGKKTITVGDVTRHINRLHPYIRRRWAAPEKRKEFLEKLVRVEILSQEAERLGLADDPEVQRTVKQVMIRLMIKEDLEKEIFPEKIKEEILEEKYREDIDKYHRPAQVRLSHIVLKTRPAAEKLLADLQKRAKDARYFRKKARELSIDEKSKERGGDVGYVSEPNERRDDEADIPAAIVEAAWKLERNGEIGADVVASDQGFHIVKLTNRRPEMKRSFESVKRMIESRLLREKRGEAMDAFIEDLKSKEKIEIFEANLEKLQAMPNSQSPGGKPLPSLAVPKKEKVVESQDVGQR
jgi:parvulin-like peptidyl-prolyl isomerase